MCIRDRDIQDYKYRSDIEIKDFDSSTNTYYLEAVSYTHLDVYKRQL